MSEQGLETKPSADEALAKLVAFASTINDGVTNKLLDVVREARPFQSGSPA
jgi:hypothetical protein